MDGTAFEVIVGAFMPVIIDWVNTKTSDQKQRYAASVVICLLVGVIFNIQSLNLQNILTSGAVIFASAQTAYKTYWRNSDARTKLFPDSIDRTK